MDEKDRARYISAALAFGLSHQDAEDVAQDTALRRLENIGLKQSKYHAVIDYLRRTYGRGGYYGNVQLNEKVLPSEERPQHAFDILDGLDHDLRAVLLLRGIWGMSPREIAFLFGVTEFVVHDRIKRVSRALLKRANKLNSSS